MAMKVVKVFLIITGVILATMFLTVIMPTLATLFGVAANDTPTGNYWGYQEAAQGMPIFVYFLPAMIGILLIVLILRAKNR